MLRQGAADRLKEPGVSAYARVSCQGFRGTLGMRTKYVMFFFYRVNALGERDVLRPSARTVGCQGICIQRALPLSKISRL
jgi:hypothetical protein